MSQSKVSVTGAAGSTGRDVLRGLVRQVDERSQGEGHEEACSGY